MDIESASDIIGISLLRAANDLALAQARMIYESIPAPVVRTGDAYIPSSSAPSATYAPPSVVKD